MHKPRNRRAARGWFGLGSGGYGRSHVLVMMGIFLLFGSISLLQLRLAEDGSRRTSWGKNNGTAAYSLDALEREKMRLVREERDLDLEREYRIMLAEEGEGDVVTEREANFDDELETESRLEDSEKEKEDEEDGGESLEEELEAEMEKEDEDENELESFQGDVRDWLNEVDEFSGKNEMAEEALNEKSEELNADDPPEGLDFDANSWNERRENRRGLEETKPRLESRQHVLPISRSIDNENELEPKEVVQPRSKEEGNKRMTKEDGARAGIQESSEPSWVQYLGQRMKATDQEEEVISSSQASKKKSAPSLYLRGARTVGSREDLELTDKDEQTSTHLKDSGMGRGVFTTDDEPVDDDTLREMENMVDLEDVLMIKKNPSSRAKLSDKGSGMKTGSRRSAYDFLNPANNPLLQDPDTNEGGGLTKSDRLLLKARKQYALSGRSFHEGENAFNLDTTLVTSSEESSLITASKEEAFEKRNGETEPENFFKNDETRLVNHMKLTSEEGVVKKPDERPETVTSSSSVAKLKNPEKHRRKGRSSVSREMNDDSESSGQDSRKAGKQVHKLQTNGDTRRWGQFPGLHPMLSFTGFMEEFLLDEKCGLRVFMAWTTPPWSFTVRHQRVMESLLSFHPDACVVVFSESIELTFFQSFVDEGYRVAVAIPQLRELLEDTPSDFFAEIYLEWRKVELFYRHYTELLRLAALYKYGGIYLDMDVIVLNPLTSLHNTLGSESLPDGHSRPNGAVMVFDRFSPFLNACMVEFTATYDEKLVEWNGAALLDRVVNERLLGGDGSGGEMLSSYSVREPTAFFPLSTTEIFRYFVAPENETGQVEEDLLYKKIVEESYTVHLWNSLTSNRVPEPGSLVHRLMERKCLRCTDIL
ncbi:hypothetical protein R1flu_000860 [Riccia fluitans]|uniref:Alpha 1,4-glycosyltransferase domain-containing protein n=1 Tax=Riccia fluitans TaxID=41844 RepID=A0ABD1Y1M5_9MARC